MENDKLQSKNEAEKARIRKRYRGSSTENSEYIPARENRSRCRQICSEA